MIRPWSMTRIVSASRIVERRWAITKLVRPFMSFAQPDEQSTTSRSIGPCDPAPSGGVPRWPALLLPADTPDGATHQGRRCDERRGERDHEARHDKAVGAQAGNGQESERDEYQEIPSEQAASD